LNNKSRQFFLAILKDKAIINQVQNYGSDTLDNINIQNINRIVIEKIIPERAIPDRDGGFFAQVNTSPIDLSGYQIYNEKQIYDKNIIEKREHCLIEVLLQYGIPKSIINEIKLSYVAGQNINQSNLKNIANKVKRNIILCKINGEKISKRLIKAEDTNGEDLSIALFKNHYFKFEETIYSKYSINHLEKLRGYENFHEITKIVFVKGKEYQQRYANTKINSLLLVKILDRKGYFTKMDLSKFEEASSNIETRNEIYLENIANEQRECTLPKIKQFKGRVYFADTETFVHEKGQEHKLYLIGVDPADIDEHRQFNVVDENGNRQTTVDKFLQYMVDTTQGKEAKSDIVCYFHNLKYDITILEKYLNITAYTTKDNQYYNCTVKFKGVRIEFRDSYKLVSMPLSAFPKMFNMPEGYRKLEAIAYQYYTEENNNRVVKTSEYTKLLSKEQKIIFKQMIKTKEFNPLELYKEYLKLDCDILKIGIKAFKEHIASITKCELLPEGLNIYNHLTISSIADKYLAYRGAYDGVYENCGNLREFVSMGVLGGRVCCNDKFVKKVIEGKIADFDAVSLYPSAMERLCKKNGGIAKGRCVRYEPENLNQWEKKYYSILKVKITKVNKQQQMPMITLKTKDSIKYINYAPEENVIIDTYTLQDYIKFHEIEYQIIDGVYWDNGGNTTIGEVMGELHNERKKQKALKNPIQATIKLIMNSAYGKTIMKKTKLTKNIVKTHKWKKDPNGRWEKKEYTNFNNYVYNNFNTITGYRKINDETYEVEQLSVDNSYNRGHVGCAILSISKRIMNEVFDIANTEKFNIYYTDTDSIHCDVKDVNSLNLAYFLKHKKQLIGTELGQFHTDFDLKGACGEIYSTKSIFLGKKSYIDSLESVDKDGNKITGFHIRLKGITKEGLEHEAKKYKNSYWDLYVDLARGKRKKILLNPFNKDNNSKKETFHYKAGKVLFRNDLEKLNFNLSKLRDNI
jgi:hypothetical protein